MDRELLLISGVSSCLVLFPLFKYFIKLIIKIESDFKEQFREQTNTHYDAPINQLFPSRRGHDSGYAQICIIAVVLFIIPCVLAGFLTFGIYYLIEWVKSLSII